MKQAVVLLVLLTGTAMAQHRSGMTHQISSTSIIQGQEGPTYSDIYCAGFVSAQRVPKLAEVIGGWDSPHQVRFADRNYVYLTGSGFQLGSEYSVVRPVGDPNRYEMFAGQHAMLRRTGHMYADVGRLRVLQVEGSTAITTVEFSCESMLPGDIAIPFVERPQVKYHRAIAFDRFARPNGKLTGRIVMAKDFDNQIATGNKVYLNVGADQGVKPGDYFRITRTYSAARKVEIDALSYHGVGDDATSYDPNSIPAAHVKEFPRISLGEAMVLSVTPRTSTAMITLALEDVHLGDTVEMEEPVVEQAALRVDSALAKGKNSPTISCFANPVTVHAGETSTVSCEAVNPDNRPLSFSFSSDHGQVSARGNTAILDTHDAGAGPVTVIANVTDDRNLSAAATATVNVEAGEFKTVAAKVNDLEFKPNSANVNNVSKAVLDDLALRMQQDPGSSTLLMGMAADGEPSQLAQQRAANARDYLTKTKGIDSQRVQMRSGNPGASKAEIWWVPAGADAAVIAAQR